MRKNLFVWGGIFAAVLMQSFMLKSDDKINFRETRWSEIGKNAKNEEKMIFVMVTTDWCGVCRKMEKVLKSGDVGHFYNRQFVNTRFDGDNTVQQFRASNWGVSAVPAMIFLDKNRNVVHKVQGYRDTKGMLKEAEIALSKMEK